MFYKVGEWKDYAFILDGRNSSCKMVKLDKLNEFGVDYRDTSHTLVSSAKLRMLYKFKSVSNNLLCKSLVLYKLPLRHRTNNKLKMIYVSLLVYILGDCKILFAISSAFSACYNKYIEHFYIDREKLLGIVIPESMLHYIMQLAQNQDLDGILNAVDGLVSSNLIVGDNFITYDDKDIFDVNWQ